MKRSTGLYFILVPFMWMFAQMIRPVMLWEMAFMMIAINVGCKALIKD